jgi:hypothetical protein
LEIPSLLQLSSEVPKELSMSGEIKSSDLRIAKSSHHIVVVGESLVDGTQPVLRSRVACAEGTLLVKFGIWRSAWLLVSHVRQRTGNHVALYFGIAIDVIIKTVEPHRTVVLTELQKQRDRDEEEREREREQGGTVARDHSPTTTGIPRDSISLRWSPSLQA